MCIKDHFVGLCIHFNGHRFDWLPLKLLQIGGVDDLGNQLLVTLLHLFSTQFHVINYCFTHQRLTIRLLIIVYALRDPLENFAKLRLLPNCSFKLIEVERVTEAYLRHAKMENVFGILICFRFLCHHFQRIDNEIEVN